MWRNRPCCFAISIENGRCIWRGRLMPSFAAAAEPLLFLDLGDNDLAALPSEIGSLTGLTFLGLANNKLTELPLELTQLTHLAAVDLSGISSTVSFVVPLESLMALGCLTPAAVDADRRHAGTGARGGHPARARRGRSV
jgi:hypothetical protein